MFFSQPVDLDYFEEAVDFILSLKEVDSSKGVGVCGISKGKQSQSWGQSYKAFMT